MLERIPDGLEEILAVYGTPGFVEEGRFVPNQTWIRENLRRFNLSFPLHESWSPYRTLTSFLAHRLVGDAMVDALEEIQDYFGLGRMQHHGLDYWGGVYNPRMKTGEDEPSLHAWAVAIDYCPALGPYGEPSRMPWVVVEAFTKRGFEWGGLWQVRDGHHFQMASGY